eukprot:GHVN01049738.1.p1 GENE.GHVN01049738.1~~GHVN01049738.1.p1  ORF type:complete len:131 (+),score=13.96 GHVN01049738.1:229-621(+)
MGTSRILHSQSILGNGYVMVCGGETASYNIKAGSGMLINPTTNSRVNPSKIVTLNTTEIYNPTTNTWTPAASMGIDRKCHPHSTLPDRQVMVCGGTSSMTGTSIDTTEIFLPTSQYFSNLQLPEIPSTNF